MLKITDKIWIGNSDDEKKATKRDKFGRVLSNISDSVLIVAQDMTHNNDWDDGVEYMQVGLIDGPGNPLSAYHAAVLALVTLVKRGTVLICCHDGGRSLAIVIMYLYLMGDGPSWDEALERLCVDPTVTWRELPAVNEVHRKAFFMMDWGMLTRVLDGEV